MSKKPTARLDLSCAACGSNRLRFPPTDEGLVLCEDCGVESQSLRELKARYSREFSEGSPAAASAPQAPADRAARRERHSSEVAASQADLKESIAETDRLVDESDEMLRRHRRECDEEEGN